MKRTVQTIVGLLVVCAIPLILLSALDKHHETSAQKGHHHAHKAHHGGSLNVVEMCSVGHAEVALNESTLCVWFVGGENDTGIAVRVPDSEIALKVVVPGQEEKTLVLAPTPSELSEETPGECSRFEGVAEWLKDVKEFEAVGEVTFKGKKRVLRIDFPHGYEGDGHDHEHGHEHEGEQ